MNMPGMSQRLVNVDFLTTEYRVIGKVMVSHTGLYGLLADPTKSFVEVRQAQVAYLRSPARVVRAFKTASITKERIYVACLEKRETPVPQPTAFHGYASYQSYPIHLAFAGFELECKIEWTGRFEVGALLVANFGKFINVYDAVLTASAVRGFELRTPAAFVNVSRLDLAALITEGEKLEAEPR